MKTTLTIKGERRPIDEVVKEYGKLILTYCENNKAIQVRTESGKYLDNLKYDWGENNAAKTVSGGLSTESTSSVSAG